MGKYIIVIMNKIKTGEYNPLPKQGEDIKSFVDNELGKFDVKLGDLFEPIDNERFGGKSYAQHMSIEGPEISRTWFSDLINAGPDALSDQTDTHSDLNSNETDALHAMGGKNNSEEEDDEAKKKREEEERKKKEEDEKARKAEEDEKLHAMDTDGDGTISKDE